MIKPYYETANGKLYCGDCLKIMPGLEPVDLVLTDPPYIGLKGGLDVTFTSGVANSVSTQKTVGDPWRANLDWIEDAWALSTKGMIVFCSFHSVGTLQNDNSIALITWYQRNAMPSMNNVPQYKTEFAWAYKKEPGLKWRNLETFYNIPRLQSGCMAKERIVDHTGKAVHPSQKPVALMIQLLKIAPLSMLDLFAGTGTALIACERLGIRWIGIEKEEKYCEIAKQRITRETQQTKLW